MRALRMHRATALVLALVVAVSATTFAFARSAQQDNERRLLELQADQMAQMVQSLASSQQAPVQSAATVAANGGDIARYKPAADVAQQWAVLRRSELGFTVDEALGAAAADLPALAALQADPGAMARLTDSFTKGTFVVLGMTGAGLDRRLSLAAGVPGGGDIVAYNEIPLVQAAATSAANQTSGDALTNMDFALYVGTDESAAGLVMATTDRLPITGRRVARTIDIGEMPITFVIRPRVPLSGSLSTEMPWVLAGVMLFGGVLIALVMELNLRKRDDALLLVAARDEADERRTAVEAELRQAQRLEAVGQLAGGIAHDFNNLLAAIMSYADLVADDLADHPAREDVEEIRKAARRGASLTRQLLLFSSKDKSRPEVLDLNVVVAELHRLLARTIGEDIELRTHLAPNLPPVAVDAGELEQVLMNLVVNARDAVDGGGTIAITTDVVDLDDDAAGAHGIEEGEYVRLAVTDDGAGMAPEVAARAFEPFFTTKDRGRGTGLGLATVYGIVQRAGGHLSVASAVGAGTTIEILLPVAAGEADAVEPEAEADAHEAASGQTVLLVEDESAVRRAARRMLERAGYRVVEAPDGAAAIELLPDVRVDVLLTDVIMPGGLTGQDVADTLRASHPEVPVVFMSGYSADILAARGLSDGPEVVVQKPFSEQELLGALADALAPVGAAR